MRNISRNCPTPGARTIYRRLDPRETSARAPAFFLSRSRDSADKLGMRDLLALSLVCFCLSGTGCFVFEEIDKGQEEMRKHSPAAKNDPAEQAKTEQGGGGLLSFAALRKRGAGAIGDLSGRVEKALQPAPDPDNVVVSCQIDGRTEFTRKFDCQSRGGRVLGP